MMLVTGTEREQAKELNYLVKTYIAVTGLITSTKLRLHGLDQEIDHKHDPVLGGLDLKSQGEGQDIYRYTGLESVKGVCERLITNSLKYYPLWNEWLSHIPGVGPRVAGTLINMYYYKRIPVCPCGGFLEKKESTMLCTACGKSAKGDGVLQHNIYKRDFPNVSSWWRYLGMHVQDGKKPRRKKGQVAAWSTVGRTAAYFFGQSIQRQPSGSGHPYREFYDERKAYRLKTHPEASKGHRNSMALNETSKLFLSHFWHVARELEGLSTDGPYVQVHMGHTGIIKPYYWESKRMAA